MADLEKDRKEERREDNSSNSVSNSNNSQAPVNTAVARYADISPNKRYLRWNEVILQSQSSVQSSYKAFDTKNGIEVVWHTINLNSLSETEQNRIVHCVNIVKKIQNKYVIEYQSSWFTTETRTLHIITSQLERLDEFIVKVKTLRWRIIKKWAKQILRGLSCLHSSVPVIVHRNLTCSHIYINGGTSHTNIGDLWMGSVLDDSETMTGGGLLSESMVSVFTAPEEILSPKLDIYSFGMCVLAMVSREDPYSECQGNVEKSRRYATQGRLPKALSQVQHPLAREFIQSCLQPVDQRPDADTLLEHEFLNAGVDDDEEVLVPTKATEDEAEQEQESHESDTQTASNKEKSSAEPVEAEPSVDTRVAALVISTSESSQGSVANVGYSASSESSSNTSDNRPSLTIPESPEYGHGPYESKVGTPAGEAVMSLMSVRSPLSPAVGPAKTPNATSPITSTTPRPVSLLDAMNNTNSNSNSNNNQGSSSVNSGGSRGNDNNIADVIDESSSSLRGLSRGDSFASSAPAERQQDITLKLGRQLADFDQSENMHMVSCCFHVRY